MYIAHLSEEEKKEFFEEISKEKDRNVFNMMKDIYQSKNFVLATDKSVAVFGELSEISKLLTKTINYILMKNPETTDAWIDYFKDIVKQLEEGDD